MANLINAGTFHPRRVNQYVRALQYSSDVNYNGFTRVDFGAPAASAAANVAGVTQIDTAKTLDLTGVAVVDAPYGRTMQFVGGATIIAGSSITIRGYDYLNQPMSEVLTTVAGVTPILGIRAFKYLTSVTYAANGGTTPATVTMSMGYGGRLGLPYRALDVTSEIGGNILRATTGTLVGGPFSQTSNAAGQADPRGTFTPNTPLNGVNTVSAHFVFGNDLFPDGRCGLHGFPHAG